MPDVTILDIPESTLRRLECKAARNEQSLEAYLLDLLVREVTGPALSDAMNRFDREARTTPSIRDVLDAIGRDRD
jgi:antitoxin FitA